MAQPAPPPDTLSSTDSSAPTLKPNASALLRWDNEGGTPPPEGAETNATLYDEVRNLVTRIVALEKRVDALIAQSPGEALPPRPASGGGAAHSG